MPAVSIYEVFKRTLQQRGEETALQVAALMAQGQVVELDQTLAISAAKISHDLKIPMADSMILATAGVHTHLVRKGLRIGKSSAVFGHTPTRQLLIAKTALHFQTQLMPQLRVITEFEVGI